MAAVGTIMREFYVDSTTTTPVILKGEVNKDYFLRRFHCEGTDIKIGLLVTIEDDDLDEIIAGASNGQINGIVPDTPFNRRQLEKDNNADWSYSLSFSADTQVEVAILINNIVVRAEVAASNAVLPNDFLECVGGGLFGVQAASGVAIGKPLAFTTSGTGTLIIPAILFAAQTGALHA